MDPVISYGMRCFRYNTVLSSGNNDWPDDVSVLVMKPTDPRAPEAEIWQTNVAWGIIVKPENSRRTKAVVNFSRFRTGSE